jgi:hypothetical protein
MRTIKEKITPGKWEADEHNIRAENKSFSIGMAYLINVPGPHNKFTPDAEGLANARLFAASKEMLDIIERLAKAPLESEKDGNAQTILWQLGAEAKHLLTELNTQTEKV